MTVSGLSLSSADAGNYVLSSDPVTTTANILAATLSVTGITADNKPFDGTTAATLETAGATLVGVVGSDDVTLDTSEAVGTFDSPDVGNDKTVTITGLSLSGADAGNYVLSSDPVTTTANIGLIARGLPRHQSARLFSNSRKRAGRVFVSAHSTSIRARGVERLNAPNCPKLPSRG